MGDTSLLEQKQEQNTDGAQSSSVQLDLRLKKKNAILYPIEIPLFERVIQVTAKGRMHALFFGKVEIMHVDEVGLFVYHDGKQELTPKLIRKYLTCKQKTSCLIFAESIEDAINIFYEEWDGATVGGEHENSKAIWIDRVDEDGTPSYRTIIEYPRCPHMFQNKIEEVTCGRPIYDIKDHPEKKDRHWNTRGEFGMCALEGMDTPEDSGCPMEKYHEWKNKLPEHTLVVGGKEFRYITARDISAIETMGANKRRLRIKDIEL